jgi:hypothetical protein
VSHPIIYRRALDHSHVWGEFSKDGSGDGRAYDAAHRLLTEAATACTGDTTPQGCLLASATADGSAASADVQRAVADIRTRMKIQLRARIERDILANILPPGTDAAALCAMVMAVAQGMPVLARDGKPRACLLARGKQTLKAWPSPNR